MTNSATFSVGYSALFPATPSGAYDSATTANRTLVFIFMLLFRHSTYLICSFQTLPMLLFVLPNPPAASDCPIGRSTDSCLRRFGTLLSRSIHSTEKAAEVSRQCNDDYGHSLDWQAVSGQDLFLVPSGSPMDEPHHPDQDGRCAPHHQMRQEDPFQFLTLEFPLPGQYSGDNHGYGCNRRDEQVVIGSRSQQALPLPLRKEIKEDGDDKQSYREVDQHHVLRVFGKQCCSYVERMQVSPHSLHDDFA